MLVLIFTLSRDFALLQHCHTYSGMFVVVKLFCLHFFRRLLYDFETRSGMDHTVLPANFTISAFTRKRFQPALPRTYAYSERLSSTYYSFIDPQEDEWLSWPWRLVNLR